MTEKRFEIDSKMYGATDIEYYLKDNANELVDGYGDEIYWGNGSTNGLKQIVNKLNELHEENQQCENEIARLQLINNKLKDKDYTNYKKKIQELHEENKELKSLCKVLIKHIKKKSIAFVIDKDIRRLLE